MKTFFDILAILGVFKLVASSIAGTVFLALEIGMGLGFSVVSFFLGLLMFGVGRIGWYVMEIHESLPPRER